MFAFDFKWDGIACLRPAHTKKLVLLIFSVRLLPYTSKQRYAGYKIYTGVSTCLVEHWPIVDTNVLTVYYSKLHNAMFPPLGNLS